MAKIKSHRELEAWKQAMDLAEDCYRVTNNFPAEERFSLTSPRLAPSASFARRPNA